MRFHKGLNEQGDYVYRLLFLNVASLITVNMHANESIQCREDLKDNDADDAAAASGASIMESELLWQHFHCFSGENVRFVFLLHCFQN